MYISFNPRTHTGCDGAVKAWCRLFKSGFNPRTHTGCDFDNLNRKLALKKVSIHAPTRGATNVV